MSESVIKENINFKEESYTTIAIMIFLFIVIFFSDLIIWENWYNLNVSLNNKWIVAVICQQIKCRFQALTGDNDDDNDDGGGREKLKNSHWN